MVGFNYDYFRGLLDGGGAGQAMEYYRNHFGSMSGPHINLQKLEVAGRLEVDYEFRGVIVNPKDSRSVLLTEDCVDSVVATMCVSQDIRKRLDSLPAVVASA